MASANSVSVLSTSIALLTAAYAMFLVVFQNTFEIPEWIKTFFMIVSIPVIGYLLTLFGTSIYQFGKCKKVDFRGIALSSTAILASLGFTSFVLYMESVPILKYIFGTYAPRNPVTGEEYSQNSNEYVKGMEDENHYKLQFFSNIVKAVLPNYLSDDVKGGFAYGYWVFFLTLLPSYFLMSLSSAC
jgi:hypothetical protein